MVDDGTGAEIGESPDVTAEPDRLLAAAGASRSTVVAGFPVSRGIPLLHGGERRVGAGRSRLDAAISYDSVATVPPGSRPTTSDDGIELEGDGLGRLTRWIVDRPSTPSASG